MSGAAMWGADSDGLSLLGSRFRQASEHLERIEQTCGQLLHETRWHGADAERQRTDWSQRHRPVLHHAAAQLRDAAAALLRDAAAQRAASAAAAGPPAAIDPNRFFHERLPEWTGRLGTLPPSRWTMPFDARSTGREDLVEAFWATDDRSRAAEGEFEIRRLDNGRWMVILPGVVDLSAGAGRAEDGARQGAAFGAALGMGLGPPGALAGAAYGAVAGAAMGAYDEWFGSDAPDTVRRMEYAIGEADRGREYDNPYSRQVRLALEQAGVPSGADVILMGHSFGAYTAMDLAADSSFNRTSGDGFHVNVTHVMAAGADTNWRLPDVPARTDVLIFNSSNDRVVDVEDVRHADVHDHVATHVERDFAGDGRDYGHKPKPYVDYLSTTDDPAVVEWLDRAGTLYASGGVAYSVAVPDVGR